MNKEKKFNPNTVIFKEVFKPLCTAHNPFYSYDKFNKWAEEWTRSNIQEIVSFLQLDCVPVIEFCDDIPMDKNTIKYAEFRYYPIYDLVSGKEIDSGFKTISKHNGYKLHIVLYTRAICIGSIFCKSISEYRFMLCLAHELTHFKQFYTDSVGFINTMQSYIDISAKTMEQYKSQNIEKEAIRASVDYLTKLKVRPDIMKLLLM